MAGGGGSSTGGYNQPQPTGFMSNQLGVSNQQQPTGGLSQPLMFKPTSMPTSTPTSIPSQPQVQQPSSLSIYSNMLAQQAQQPQSSDTSGGFASLADRAESAYAGKPYMGPQLQQPAVGSGPRMVQPTNGPARPGDQIMGGMGQTGGGMPLANTQGSPRPMGGFNFGGNAFPFQNIGQIQQGADTFPLPNRAQMQQGMGQAGNQDLPAGIMQLLQQMQQRR